MDNRQPEAADRQNVEHWSREGFFGDGVTVIRPHHTPDYVSAQGPHAPHRLRIEDLVLPDRGDPGALPVTVLASRSGVRLSVSGRQESMPFVLSNVEADEIHFVQNGELQFMTAFGTITGLPGDFVCIPRAVPYRVCPLKKPTLSVSVEVPGAVKLDPRPPFALDVERAIIDRGRKPGAETIMLVKSFDGITRYVKPHDPLSLVTVADGTIPVWKLNLRTLFTNPAGHPAQFASSPNSDVLLYNLSARRRRRPPIHSNADYDEVIFYFSGPGAWGHVKEPGTLTWVPKGVAHHGPSEDVAEGYLAWLLESRATLRLTPEGAAIAELTETDMYGPLSSSS